MTGTPSLRLLVCAALAASGLPGLTCARGAPAERPLATPSISIDHESAPAGSPIEITYRFVVAADARFDGDHWVMVHVVDADEELMWTDDHQPPVPTTRWNPGETIAYTRTIFVPIFPYIGDATIHVGLYRCSAPPTCNGPNDQTRLPLSGDHAGQRAYRVGHLNLLPQSENLFTVFKDGWHPAEVAGDNTGVEWQWTKKEATLGFRNPKRDVKFVLDLDNPGGRLTGPQRVRVSVGDQPVEEFTLEPDERVLRKMTLSAVHFGAEEIAEVRISVDKTFIPAELEAGRSRDPRELGVRVFHAFVDGR